MNISTTVQPRLLQKTLNHETQSLQQGKTIKTFKPNIGFSSVAFAVDDFRAHPVRSAQNGLRLFLLQRTGGATHDRCESFRRTEVAELHLTAVVAQDVGAFDVTMDDHEFVEVGKAFEHLSRVSSRHVFGEHSVRVELVTNRALDE